MFHIPDSLDPGYLNQQGWLSPCHPKGQRWQGQLYIVIPRPPDQSKSACHPPHTTRAGGADQDGHPDKVKARGVAGEPKKRWGLGYLNNLENIFKAAPALTGITSNFQLPKTADSIEKRLPPPTPQDRAESDQDGHPDKVKTRRGGKRAEKG
ncbi:MAG: hypothetical protein IBX40_08945 [Methanosarcinales archaeon]|nr:hypothetical protein [Methanosarcinales archaeon]